MSHRGKSALVLILLILSLLPAPPAQADGGPYLNDQEVWQQLEEGQQVAVVRLDQGGVAHTDLFVSILDHSGARHELTFFVPLGAAARDVDVEEMQDTAFDARYTQALDERLRQDWEQQRDYHNRVTGALLPGAVFLNGGWVWLGLAGLSSCGAQDSGPQPEQVFETKSGVVAIYGMDERTDVDALIAATGLPQGVRETLESVRGQRLAVVTLVTNPDTAPSDAQDPSPGPSDVAKSGLRLSWTSDFVSGVHHYPLGTGQAWANPIPLTRVYVTAPPGVGFEIEAPAIGEDYSGYTGVGWFGAEPIQRIYAAQDLAAYAFDQIVTPQGQLWRGIYTNANPGDDVIITLHEPLTQSRYYRFWSLSDNLWLVHLAGALIAWLLAWRYLTGRFVDVRYTWSSRAFWTDSLYWLLIGPFISLAFLPFMGFAFVVGLTLIFETPICCLFGVFPLFLAHALTAYRFARHGPGLPPKKESDSRWAFDKKAAQGFLAVAAAANGIYWLWFLAFALYLAVA